MPHNLLAHGDAQNFWIARVDLVPAGRPGSALARTTIYTRQLGEEGKWQPLTLSPIPARVISLASQNGLAAALLDDGSWMFLYPDSTEGPTNAKSLPQPARMIALAGGRNAWWAIGVAPGGIAALPATQPTSAPTQPAAVEPVSASQPAATHPAEGRLVLFSFTGNDWKAHSELPDSLDATPGVSLAIIDDTPYLADVVPGGVRVRHFDNGRWLTDGTWTDLPPLAGIKLLSNSSVPLLWVQPISGDHRVYTLNKSAPAIAHLTPIPDSSPADQTVVIATGKFRMLGIVKGDVVDQDYALPQLKPDGARSMVGLPQTSVYVLIERVQWFVVAVALVAAFVGSMRQRSMIQEGAERLAGLTLAPLGRRLAAGVIDMLPALLAFAFGYVHFAQASNVTEANRPVILLLIYWCAGIVYVAYMTAFETMAGRSFGKMLLGLRVVGLDGAPAKPGALVTRNVLRIIDIGLWLVPLLIITIFPLRQRAGDVAAGTLVISGNGETPNAEKSEENVASNDGES
ncbi:MAG TPA: RDD family protein [Tepidisphaeraceae bacterium]